MFLTLGLLCFISRMLGHLGLFLGPLVAILWPSWALLGPPWGHFGVILGALGAIWEVKKDVFAREVLKKRREGVARTMLI